jgi:hypothetical protein
MGFTIGSISHFTPYLQDIIVAIPRIIKLAVEG